jgi:isopentenyl-diphosphate Delta-isomerase
MTFLEPVVLVSEDNEPIGLMEKAQVHGSNTPRHRGFSLFLFRPNGALLLQQRGAQKVAWPLVWSNSCCGHLLPSETPVQAVIRRAHYELGISLKADDIIPAAPDYRYRFERDGIVENEICPVFIAITDQPIVPNATEIEAVQWVGWHEFISSLEGNSLGLSPWCVEESQLIASVVAEQV